MARDVFGPSPDVFGTSAIPNTLAYAPPVQNNPTMVSVPTTFFSATYADNQDVILQFPNQVRTSGLSITGGRHIRIIGGSQQITATGTPIQLRGVTSSVFIEGLFIDNSQQPSPTDAINACGRQLTDAKGPTYPDIYLQNCRVTNVHGQNTTNHSDIYQPQGPIGRLFVDKFTGDSNYQGFFIAPQYPISAAYFSRVNLGYNQITPSDPITYLLWLQDSGETPYPVSLSDFYVMPRAGQTVDASAVWPASNQATIGCVVLSDGTITWPGNLDVTGVVTPGVPPSGDYVSAGSVGIGYKSPGYQSPVPIVLSASAARQLPWDDTAIVATFDWRGGSAAGTFTANQGRGGRVRIPTAGTLHDIAISVGTASGNISVAIYDVGQTTNGTRTQLWTTGAIACPAAGTMAIVGDPSLAVQAGQYLEFWLSCDNATATFVRATPSAITLPSSYPVPPGALASPNSFAPVVGSTHPLPATLSGTAGAGGILPLIAARIS